MNFLLKQSLKSDTNSKSNVTLSEAEGLATSATMLIKQNLFYHSSIFMSIKKLVLSLIVKEPPFFTEIYKKRSELWDSFLF